MLAIVIALAIRTAIRIARSGLRTSTGERSVIIIAADNSASASASASAPGHAATANAAATPIT